MSALRSTFDLGKKPPKSVYDPSNPVDLEETSDAIGRIYHYVKAREAVLELVVHIDKLLPDSIEKDAIFHMLGETVSCIKDSLK